MITITPGRKGQGVCSGLMYTINRVPTSRNGVTLTCNECSHTERVNEFDDRLGSRRTQAARAMLKRVRNEHGKEPIGKPLTQIIEKWY